MPHATEGPRHSTANLAGVEIDLLQQQPLLERRNQMDEEEELNIHIIDYDALNHGMEELIDVVSKFKSVDDMSEVSDDELIEMVNALQMTLFTAVGILYSRGQLWTTEDCDHFDDEDDDDTQ